MAVSLPPFAAPTIAEVEICATVIASAATSVYFIVPCDDSLELTGLQVADEAFEKRDASCDDTQMDHKSERRA